MRMIWNWLKTHRSQMILALASALLLTLAFPKIDMGWLAWVALTPLLLAIRQVDRKAGFVLGFSFGLLHYLGLMYWTVYTMVLYGHIPMFQAAVILILLAAYLALYPACFTSLIAWLRPKPLHLILLAPSLWVALEMLRNRLFTGFPWELLGYSQYHHLRVIQVADLFGVYAVSGLIVLFNCALTIGVLGWLELQWHQYLPSRKSAHRCAAAVLALMVGLYLYGGWRMHLTDQVATSSEQAKVALVQGNIDQAQKWDPRFQVLTVVKYRQLSLEPTAKSADLIVWPETATPFYFLADPVLTQMVMEGIKRTQAYFVIGSPSYATENREQLIYHNSAYLISPQGEPKGQYDKVHLVPFGEYVPLKRFLPFIHKLVAQVGDFRPGLRGNTLPWKNHALGMLICYEAIFPELARAMVQNGADLLVNITNDAWFGRTSAAYQHFSMAVFRAVENRRVLVRSANTGISGFIDANGRVLETTALFEQAVIARSVPLLKIHSPYSRWGDWPLGLLTFGVAILSIGRRYRHSRRRVDR
jgi:apolipoprotein N-acyltransferase